MTIREEDLNVNLLDMPTKIKGRTVPNEDGSMSIFINARLSDTGRKEAYAEEIKHIKRGDLDYDNPKDAQQIETEAHHLVQPAPTLPPARSHRKRKRRSRWAADQSRIRFLQSIGFDFMAAAEYEYLEPPE